MRFRVHPAKKIFRGKRHVVFRLFAILPVLYEITFFVLKILAGMRIVTLPFYIWPLLPAKPPVIFMIFLSIAFFTLEFILEMVRLLPILS